VLIASTPSGAAIYIDAEKTPRGKTDSVVEVPNGKFKLKVELQGYETAVRDIDPAKIANNRVDIALTPVPPPARKVLIVSTPSGAAIYVDQEPTSRGKTDRVIEIPNHKFKLTLELANYETAVRDIDPAKIVNNRVEVALTPVPPPVPKVLIATVPQGARVFIDGKEKGTTDKVFEVPGREFTLKVELAGYEPVTKTYDGSKLKGDLKFPLKKLVVAAKAMMLWRTKALEITAMACAADGKTVICGETAAGGGSGLVACYDAGNGKELWSKAWGAWLLLFSRDGANILFTDGATTLKAASAKRGDLVWSIKMPEVKRGFAALGLSADGQRLLWVDLDGLSGQIETKTGKVLRQDRLPVGFVGAATIVPDGSAALVVDLDKTEIVMIDLKSFKEIQRYRGFDPVVWQIDASRIASQLIFATSDQKGLKVWNVNTGKIVWKQQGDDFHRMAVSPDGKRLLAGKGQALCLYDITTGQQLWSAMQDHVVSVVQWAPDNRHGFAGGRNPSTFVDWLAGWQLPD
jgi:outer membrane protein assembly factor BamB